MNIRRIVLQQIFYPRHAADFISHLTADEHAGLAQLLARKDELLALLS